MLQYSKYYQNPEFLEATRKFLIPKEQYPMIMSLCGIKEDSKVLDVGSGTGFFARFIKSAEPKANVTGIEREDPFLEAAEKYAEKEGLSVDFVKGDALSLPFSDESFDTVTSHAFLNIVEDSNAAFKEMIRVCKKGGTVVSMTAMSLIPSAVHLGFYYRDCTWAKPLMNLQKKFNKIVEELNPMIGYLNGLPITKIPNLFVRNGLNNISAYPIGKVLSMSNALYPYEERLEYLDLMVEAEKKKVESYMEMEKARELFTREEADEYIRLWEEKRDYYHNHPDENAIWEWVGNCSVLITGQKT